MVFLIERISQEMIKPSSPTPYYLRDHKFSLIDQMMPEQFIPLVFFYQGNNSESTKTSNRLKQSLSKCLTSFYPLAGRIQCHDPYILCNDEGVEFFEARVHGVEFVEMIQNPEMEQIKQLLPVQLADHEDGRGLILSVQVNFFQYEGFAIAVCLSHKAGDVGSMVAFVNAWAAAEDHVVSPPSFILSRHFPPLESVPQYDITREKLVTKRLVFSREKLTALKSAISDAPGSVLKDPTRVESVLAFIWKLFNEMKKHKQKMTVFAAGYAVSMRPRSDPPFPDEAFGNCIVTPIAFCRSAADEGRELHHLAYHLRSSVRKIDAAYIKQVQDDREGYYRSVMAPLASFEGEIGLCCFSSWSRFPVYEADFGFGKPVWVCVTMMPNANYVVLMGSSCGEAIEAWVNLLEEDAKSFNVEQDK